MDEFFTPPPALPYGSVLKRFFASFIDSMLLTIAGGILFFLFLRDYLAEQIFTLMLLSQTGSDVLPGEILIDLLVYPLLILIVWAVINWLYFALLESMRGATVGKQMMGLQVTDLDGARISFLRATGRYFGKIPSGMILGVGYIMAIFTDKKQALHDILAGTLVLDATMGYAQPRPLPDLASLGYPGPDAGAGNEGYIDFSKPAPEPPPPGLEDFGSVESGATLPVATGSKPVKTFGLDEFGEGETNTITAPPQEIEDAFGPVEEASPAPPPTPRPAPVPPPSPSKPVQAAVENPVIPAEPKPAPAISEIQKPASGAAKPATGKVCPSCGIGVGLYQTQCMKCGASLKQGFGKKLFGK